MTRVDLDELERKARAATPGPWHVDDAEPWICKGHPDDEDEHGDLGSIVLELRKRPGPSNHDAAHVIANSPDVTLALIARIRELENIISRVVACEVISPGVESALIAVLEKGTVVP